MKIVARDFRTSSWIELDLFESRIASVRRAAGATGIGPADLWVAPAFWDIQTNGRWGHSFSGPELTVEQVGVIVREQARLGTARLCPTLITAEPSALLHGVRTVAAACDAFPDVAARVLGIHLEGPFLSERDGYRGAHPAAAIRDPDWDFFQTLQEESGHRIVLITLAPERPGAIEFIARARASGVTVSLGHTSAVSATFRAATAAGATLSTHLGNGIASPLARHPNPIWVQAASDALSASFIADGEHLDPETLRVLARTKGPERTILISDASPLAGLRAGDYGEWSVTDSGRIVVKGTAYLAGSNAGLETGVQNLLRATGWTIEQVLTTVTSNPARLLGRAEPKLQAGETASVVTFRCRGPEGFVLEGVWVDGEWNGPQKSARPALAPAAGPTGPPSTRLGA
jgi:N-acetylglucosamine-6-phosphate deacetylase